MNWIDVTIIAFLLYAIYQGYRRGFVIGVISLISTAVSIYLATLLFPGVAQIISKEFNLNANITPLFVFFGLLILLEVTAGIVIALIDASIVRKLYVIKSVELVDRILGVFPSLLLTALFATLLLLLPVTIPMSPLLREDVRNSYWGKNVLPQAYNYIPRVEQLANRLPTKSLLYLIPKSPSSEENVDLQLPDNLTLTVDEVSELRMLELLNQERVSRGLKPLALRKDLVPVARAHSKDMFERHYFSHVNPDAKSPFDRMDEGGIMYTNAGENLAYAPDVAIAHRGLMNSQGHRENILRPEFGRVAIGVIDAGIYGKMFSQEFTD